MEGAAALHKGIKRQNVDFDSPLTPKDKTSEVERTPKRRELVAQPNPLHWGCHTDIGGRPYMEDTYCVGSLPNSNSQFFSVFDGHGGPSVAKHLESNVKAYLSTLDTENELEDAESLVESFRLIDRSLPAGDAGGSTANVVIVTEKKIVCANCGDSRAVLSRNGKAVALSDDHKPERDDETARIKAAGGLVLNNSGWRVMGVLGMSRAIGDTWLQNYGVIPDPEVKILDRSSDDEFCILASDGLWGFISNEEAVIFAQRCMQRAIMKGLSRRAATRIAAKVLLRAALHRGSRDNITVIVVDLKPQASQEIVCSPKEEEASENFEMRDSDESPTKYVGDVRFSYDPSPSKIISSPQTHNMCLNAPELESGALTDICSPQQDQENKREKNALHLSQFLIARLQAHNESLREDCIVKPQLTTFNSQPILQNPLSSGQEVHSNHTSVGQLSKAFSSPLVTLLQRQRTQKQSEPKRAYVLKNKTPFLLSGEKLLVRVSSSDTPFTCKEGVSGELAPRPVSGRV